MTRTRQIVIEPFAPDDLAARLRVYGRTMGGVVLPSSMVLEIADRIDGRDAETRRICVEQHDRVEAFMIGCIAADQRDEARVTFVWRLAIACCVLSIALHSLALWSTLVMPWLTR